VTDPNDMEVAIKGYAIVDHSVRQLFRAYLVPSCHLDTQVGSCVSWLSFSERVSLVRGLGGLSVEAFADLNLIHAIWDTFIHWVSLPQDCWSEWDTMSMEEKQGTDRVPVTFEHGVIAGYCRGFELLEYYEQGIPSENWKVYWKTANYIGDTIAEGIDSLCRPELNPII